MSHLPPYAVPLVTLTAVVAVIVADAPLAIIALGTPAALAVLASAKGRHAFGRRLLVSAPLAFVALALRWWGHAQDRELLAPALRVMSAVAWASCLSTLLEPREIRAALRSLAAPPALIELIAHMRRFAIQLGDTATEAWNAAALRAGLLSVRATAGTVGQVAGVIVVRAFDRAECVAIATALRGGHLADDAPLEQQRASRDQSCWP